MPQSGGLWRATAWRSAAMISSNPSSSAKKCRYPFGYLHFLFVVVRGSNPSKCHSPVDCGARRLDGAQQWFHRIPHPLPLDSPWILPNPGASFFSSLLMFRMFWISKADFCISLRKLYFRCGNLTIILQTLSFGFYIKWIWWNHEVQKNKSKRQGDFYLWKS